MAIKITVGDEDKPVEGQIKHSLNIRKTLDGNLIIADHEELDIVINQKDGKIVAMSTDEKVNDKVYDSQNRFFKFLSKNGIVDPSSVRFGHIFGALEGVLLQSEDPKINSIDLAILNIAKWINKEKPSNMFIKQMKKNRIDDLTEPDEDESTELGKIKQSTQKGGTERSINSQSTNLQKPY